MLLRGTVALLSVAVFTGAGAGMANAVEVDATPERVSVRHSYEYLNWTLSGVDWSQDRYEWCSITLEHKATRSYVDSDMPDEGVNSGTLRVDDYMVRPGVHQVIADCYFSGRAVDEVTIKFGARSAIQTAARSGRRVSIAGVVRRWSTTDTRFTGWRNTPVKVQKKTSAGWRTVTTVTSDRGGRVSAVVRSPRRIAWRLVSPANASTWSSTSLPVRR